MDNRQILSEIIVQVLGFAAVFFILKRFAWGKLLGAIDNRRKTIEDAFAGIEREKQKLASFEKDYQLRLDQIEQEARVKIQEASAIGMTLARDIQEKARQDAQKILDRAKSEIDQDLVKARLAMRNQIVELSGLMTEKVLKEKLDAPAHEKLVERFLKEIEKI